MFKRALTLVCCTLLFAIFCVRADNWDKKTVVTFSQPVELPGVVLEAGTYVFKLVDSPSDRHIVRVFSEDETHLYATILAIPNYRLEPTGDTVIRFAERAATAPPALRAWFYPGDNFGQEFVYPKARATNIAAETKAPVLAAEVTPETKTEELVKAPVETIAPPVEEAVVEPSRNWTEVEPTPPPIELEPTPAPVPAEPELPKTASPLPAIMLLGISSLTLAWLLKHLTAS